MTDRTAAPERGIQRAKTTRRGGPSGRQAVGDYVGQPAGDAAQAVRRTGLRPGLDRSFGCAEELTGLVVAQEPTAGSDLARNGMVTLYVAAPGKEPVDGDRDADGLDSDVPPAAPPVQAEVAQSEGPSAPARARRRKPGRARRAAPAFDPAPAPVLPDRDSKAQPPTLAQPAVEQRWDWSPETFEQDGERLDDDASDELGEHEFPHDEFVVHLDDVEDVLAGRGPALWRRAYPRRRTIGRRGDGRGVRAWLGRHRLATGAVGAALAAWALVGVGSVLDGHHTHTTTAGVVSKRPSGTHRTAAAKPAPALSSKALHAAPRPSPAQSAQSRARDSEPRRRRPAPALLREAVAPPKEAAVPVAPSTPAARASAPPAPAPAQTQGGLFSP
jgi:hypothetical protein